jgi:hypothetical protein
MAPEATDPPAADVHAAPDLAVPLRAGPLRLVFDRGELRWIRLGEREVLRGIYVAVREEGWATVPAELEDLEIEAEPESFRVRFRALHRRGGVRFDWVGLVEGGKDGRITFRMSGSAGTTFRRNRIGVCVLHPAEECAGRECIVETTDGDRLEQAFPALVSPHQPFRNVRAILHEVTPGVEVEVRMEGETFETEDQRNWSDASFKTYGTPLHLPYPVEVPEGTRIEQSVSVSLFGVTAAPVRQAAAAVPGALPKKRNSTEPVVVRVGSGKGVALPALGLGGAGLVALPPGGAERLRPLRLAHLRADLRLEAAGWEGALERAVANARALDVPLELALFLPDDPRGALRDLAASAAQLRPRVASWLVFRAADGTTREGDAVLARAALGGVDAAARFGGGTDGPLADLNRRRVAARGLDRLAFALNPQVHAFDDATLVENVGSLRALADTVRGFAGGAALAISPVTLRARVDPRPLSSRDPSGPPLTDDPRQAAPFAAAWTLAFLAAAAEAGFASLTFFELLGPRGVMDEEKAFPVLHALADVAAVRDGFVLPSRSRRPERVQVLALRAPGLVRLFLANVTAEAHPVRVDGIPGRLVRAPLGDPGPGEAVEGEVELAPHEVARIDVESGAA